MRTALEKSDSLSKKRSWKVTKIFCLLIILSSTRFFDLGSWLNIPGSFNVVDIGITLTFIMFVALFLSRGIPDVLHNRYSLFIIILTFMFISQIFLASFHYDYDMDRGFMGVRHFFYYFSFFVFFYILDSEERIISFLNLLSWFAVIAVTIGLLNYFGVTMISHKWAEGHGIRSGIVRLYLPAMSLISMATIWNISKTVSLPIGKVKGTTLVAFILLCAHIIRQTRMRIAGVVLVALGMFFLRGKIGVLAAFAIFLVTMLTVIQVQTGSNIIVGQYETTVEDIENKEGGSLTDRMIQLEAAWQEFVKYPVFGAGTAAIRRGETKISYSRSRKIALLGAKADLGYASWIKAFGIVGAIWLFMLIWNLLKQGWYTHSQENATQRMLGIFVLGYTFFLAITFITLNAFMYPGNIVLISLLMAIAARLQQLPRKKIPN